MCKGVLPGLSPIANIIPALSLTNMMQNLNWLTLEIRRTRARLIMFYKFVHQVVAIKTPEKPLQQTDLRTRHSNIYSYKLISKS